ncbi:MAG: hypothetical protein AB7P03_05815 [Kofleriaceae bacterium]
MTNRGWMIGVVLAAAAGGLAIYFVAGSSASSPPPSTDPGVAPGRWIDETRSSIVPLWALGRPVHELLTTVPGIADQDGQLQWQAVGLGRTGTPTLITVEIENNKVVWISAAADASIETIAELQQVLTARYGPPSGDKRLRWNRQPPLSLQVKPDRVYLTAGTAAKE